MTTASSNPKPNRIPKVEGALRVWQTAFILLPALHYLLGICGTISAAAVASKTPIFHQDTLNVLAWISAVCVGSLTLLSPLKKARFYHAAWIHLSGVYAHYQHTGKATASDVVDAKQEGEKIIKGVLE